MAGSREGMQDWKPEWIDALKGLMAAEWSSGRAAQKLNEQFCTAFTRSAIIGKCHRAGIQMMASKGGGRAGPKGGPSQRKVKPKVATTPQGKAEAIMQRLPRFPPVQPQFVADPLPPGAVALVDLSENGCRYPSGDGTVESPFMFCNRARLDGLPYCSHHARVAFRVTERRG